MKVIFLFVQLVLFYHFSNSQSFEILVDNRDNRSYKTVKIGSQVWMAENLGSQYFRNGDIIPQAKTKEEWFKASEEKTPAWCYYENDSSNNQKFGKLYNWYAVNDKRGLAPEGWIIPISTDVRQLIEYLCNLKGIREVGCVTPEPCKCSSVEVGDLVKLSINKEWGKKATNKTGWSAAPGGFRVVWASLKGEPVAYFKLKGTFAIWWLADSMDPNQGGYSSNEFSMSDKNDFVGMSQSNRGFGFSVRCIRVD
jgi:uncharacterized protein (TIGR02145 family)